MLNRLNEEAKKIEEKILSNIADLEGDYENYKKSDSVVYSFAEWEFCRYTLKQYLERLETQYFIGQKNLATDV